MFNCLIVCIQLFNYGFRGFYRYYFPKILGRKRPMGTDNTTTDFADLTDIIFRKFWDASVQWVRMAAAERNP